MDVRKTRSFPGFLIDSYLTESAFTAVKRDAMFETRCVIGVPLIFQYKVWEPFLSKMLYKRVRGST